MQLIPPAIRNSFASRLGRRLAASPPAAVRASAVAAVESLEDRRHFNVTVTGTNGPDVITVYQNGVTFDVTVNGVKTNSGFQPVNQIDVNCFGGDDSVFISAGVSVPCAINGGDGNDSIKGGRGNDVINGGNGKDTIYASDGNDIVRGDAGDDTLYGGLGDDDVRGGRGNDKIDGEQGNDFLLGNGTPDDGASYSDADTIHGGEGNDLVDGMGGNDYVYGDHGIDEVHGGAGNDQVYGGADNDRLMGGPGNDVLVAIGGGTGDLLWGEAGRDSFWLDDARTTELAMDGDSAESAVSAFHYVNQFENNVTVFNGQRFEERPGKELYGQDFRDPIAPETFANFKQRPLFGASGPMMQDARQGNVGDCYFIAGLSATAKANPQRIREAVVDLGDGTFAVRLAKSGVSKFYRVDADLPQFGNNPVYAQLGSNQSLWVAIMEKAFAFHKWADGGTYESLNLGRANEPFNALPAPNADYWGVSGLDVLAKINVDLKAGKAVVIGSVNTHPRANIDFIPKHQYVVQSVDMAAGKITVRNPWGYDGTTTTDANPQDGFVTFSTSQLFQFFHLVTSAKV